ncbi:Head binding [Pragia fontium]|uniref:phage head-binding domain-containing protein n=1 Tax=Pragia fontium TaxID=82985 RepID=UPI000DF8A17C|nr:phage head-binding domain-containing protein [Pragia fontium]SUB82032.1 Head binding [Pragia fontium]
MSDIMPNVVVSMPSQLFTLARSFKAVSNGRIYLGKIDTDPTIPSNQIQVYIENEDGSHVPTAQPININAAGYPVYSGQITKFVTVEGHSMAVYDAYGVQQFYFPNILKYDPDQLRQELEGPDGYLLVGGLAENYGWPSNIIVVDRPPYNGDLTAAYESVPLTGNVTLLLGRAIYEIPSLPAITKPNVAIVGSGMPKADLVTKTLVTGSGTIVRGHIVNNATGFSIYNLGIDNGDSVRNSILGGSYYDAYCNENFGADANIQYGNLVVMQADTNGGTVGLRHGIRSEWGSGVRQIGDIYIYMGYHGHVVKSSDFYGSSYTTYCQGTHADSVIIKADSGTGIVQNVNFGDVICDGGDPANPPVASTGGVLYEGSGAILTGVSFGNITARNARYAFNTAQSTNTYCSQISAGHIDAVKCDDGSNLQAVIDIRVYTIGLVIQSHNIRSCQNMIGVRVHGADTVSNDPRTDSIHIGAGQSVGNIKGYDLAGGVTHGAINASENIGWGVDFNGYTGVGSAVPAFSGIGVNSDLITGRENGFGLITSAPSAISNYIGTWSNALSFNAQIVGGSVRISGRLSKGGPGGVPAVLMLSHARPSSAIPISAWGVNGNGTLIPIEAKMDTDGILYVIGYSTAANEVNFYGEYRIK